jgi:hypothetical protein
MAQVSDMAQCSSAGSQASFHPDTPNAMELIDLRRQKRLTVAGLPVSIALFYLALFVVAFACFTRLSSCISQASGSWLLR